MSYCLTCKTNHLENVSCPPFECRTTGIDGLREALFLAEEEIKELREELKNIKEQFDDYKDRVKYNEYKDVSFRKL